MQAMAFPSVSEIPTFVFILLMIAFYAIRKEAASAYRRFTFFVVHWIQITMMIKFMFRVTIRIPFISDFFKFNPDNSFVKAATIIYGENMESKSERLSHKTQGAKAEVNHDLYRFAYCALMQLAVFVCQLWRTTKWFEIRYKT